jgi:3-deoxy-D-manno-octulosonic acid kinase
LPDGYVAISKGNATVVARRSEVAEIQGLLKINDTLFEAALQMPRIGTMHGRGIAPVVDIVGEPCVVRHFRRGGSVMSALGDRYLRAGSNRVLHELRASEAVRGRGVATPSVKFAAWYDEGIFRRYDIATSFIPSARDLADILFDDAQRTVAVTHTQKLLRDVVKAGLLHRDLNLKNILVTAERAFVLDLDRAKVLDRLTQLQASAMRTRFMRSLTKWEGKEGRKIPASARTALGEAFVV